MEITSLVGENVMHRSFGEGVIKNADGKYLEVFFTENSRWSKFSYPSCFDVFLRLENEEKENEVAKDVKEWRNASGEGQREKWKLQYRQREQAVKERRIAAEERKKKAGQRAMEYRINQVQAKNKA